MGRAKTTNSDTPADKPKRSRKQATTGTATRTSKRKTTSKASAGEEKKKKAETLWTDDLTGKLYTAIIENEEIKRGLFPPPGSNASTKDGGGKAKADFHAMLALEVFGGEGCEHKEAFEAAKTPKEKEAWTTKIKNKLQKMAKTTRKHSTALGKTGAGIRSIADVNRTQKNEFVNKFEAIIEEFPLFFEWRDLIGERPNVNPVGVGNMDSELDLTLLGDADGATSEAEDDELEEEDAECDENVDELDASDGAEADMGSDDDGIALDRDEADVEESSKVVSNMSSDDEEEFPTTASGVMKATSANSDSGSKTHGKADKTKGNAKKVAEKSGTSEGVKKRKANEGEAGTKSGVDDKSSITKGDTANRPPAKKAKPIDAVMEVAVEEEKTKQMQLAFAKSQSELNMEKIKADLAVKAQMIKAKAIESKNKSEEKRLKLQIRMKELELRERELTMRQNSQSMGFASSSSMTVPNPMLGGPSFGHQSFDSSHSRSSSPFSQGGHPSLSPLDQQMLPHSTQGSSGFQEPMGYGLSGSGDVAFSGDGSANTY